MKQRLVAIVIACLLLFGLAACVNGCVEEPAPVPETPQPTEVPNSPEPFTDDIVIGDPQQGDPLATMPPQATVTPKPVTQAPTVTPTPKTTAKTTAKATAKPTAAPTPTATAGSDVTMPELGDDPTPTPTATSTPIQLPIV